MNISPPSSLLKNKPSKEPTRRKQQAGLEYLLNYTALYPRK
jgi:hypothetical protein